MDCMSNCAKTFLQFDTTNMSTVVTKPYYPDSDELLRKKGPTSFSNVYRIICIIVFRRTPPATKSAKVVVTRYARSISLLPCLLFVCVIFIFVFILDGKIGMNGLYFVQTKFDVSSYVIIIVNGCFLFQT